MLIQDLAQTTTDSETVFLFDKNIAAEFQMFIWRNVLFFNSTWKNAKLIMLECAEEAVDWVWVCVLAVNTAKQQQYGGANRVMKKRFIS